MYLTSEYSERDQTAPEGTSPSDPVPSDREIYTLPEFLTLAGLSRQAFYQCVRRGTAPPKVSLRLPGRPSGRGVFIPKAAGNRWLARRQELAELARLRRRVDRRLRNLRAEARAEARRARALREERGRAVE